MRYNAFSLNVEDQDPIKLRDKLLDPSIKRTIFDLDKIICQDQLEVALYRADRAFDQHTNIANVWGIEVLIQMVANHQINQVLDIIGITKSTLRIGIVQDKADLPHEKAIKDFDIASPDKNLLQMYEISDITPCDDIIAKGVLLIADHE